MARREADRRNPGEEKALRFMAERLTLYRREQGLSVQLLSARAGISVQQLRRIERAAKDPSLANEPGVLTLLRLARELKADISSFLLKLPIEEEQEQEQVDKLWEEHGFGKQHPKSRRADYKARKAMLESEGLWVPPGVSPLALPFARPGIAGELRNKGALHQVLANLPDSTRMVRLLAISGVQSLEGSDEAYARLANLVARGRTRLEFMFLARKSKYFHELRAREIGEKRSAPAIEDRIEGSIDRIKNELLKAAQQETQVQWYEYNRWPLHRVLMIDQRAYVTFYPLQEGSQTPVLIFQADKEDRSFYWACHRVWWDYRLCPRSTRPEQNGRCIPFSEVHRIIANDAAAIKKFLD